MLSGCSALPISYPVCTGVKWSGREVNHLTPCVLTLRIKNRPMCAPHRGRKCELSSCNSSPYRQKLGFLFRSLLWVVVLDDNIDSMEPADIMLV